MMDLFWGYVGPSTLLADIIYHCSSLDCSKIVLLATLSAITIYRREMSCNRCYVEELSSTSRTEIDEDSTCHEEETEELLDSAGCFCSGALLVPVLHRVRTMLSLPSLKGQRSSARKFPSPKLPPVTAEEILDGAGCYCSCIPFTTSWLNPRPPRSIRIPTTSSEGEHNPFVTSLPTDAQILVLSFLHPRDVVNMACVNRASYRLVDDGETSNTLWKALWRRDYAWLIESWEVGRVAKQRSGVEPVFSKDFYFRFSLAYMNYLLAGQNNYDCCLVGIGGHIYDLSLFLSSHPGSPETVMAHAGQEATLFFAGINHSSGARRLAQQLCVAVDLSFIDRNACGARPTEMTDIDGGTPLPVQAPVTYHSQSLIFSKGTLDRVRREFIQEEADHRTLARNMQLPALLGDINLYYDPLVMKWKAWYTNTALETKFIKDLSAKTTL